jgi:hypothetical protein
VSPFEHSLNQFQQLIRETATNPRSCDTIALGDSEGRDRLIGGLAPGIEPALEEFDARISRCNDHRATTWAAVDHSRISQALKITASVLATTAVVALASFVAVALSLT